MSSCVLFGSNICRNFIVRQHRMHNMRTIAIDDPIMFVSVGHARNRSYPFARRHYIRCGCHHIIVATCWYSGTPSQQVWLSMKITCHSRGHDSTERQSWSVLTGTSLGILSEEAVMHKIFMFKICVIKIEITNSCRMVLIKNYYQNIQIDLNQNYCS